MAKIKMKILEIREEPNQNGTMLYRVFVESNGKTYQFGAKEADYLDEKGRASIHKAWLKTLRADQVKLPVIKAKSQKDIRKAIIGTEVEEDEYQ
jgi:hypothetical protein